MYACIFLLVGIKFFTSLLIELPPADVDCSVSEYARYVCAVMDIPVYDGSPNSIVQSLHVLFSLYRYTTAYYNV